MCQDVALDHVRVLCVYGITFRTIAYSDFHCFPDDIRTTFIRANGVEKLIERLIGDLNLPGAPFRNAAVDCVKALCDHGIIVPFSCPQTLTILQITFEPNLFQPAALRN